MQVTSGAFDPNTAVRSAIKSLAQQGVGAITYPSGHVDTLEVAVRRALVTGVNQTCLQMQEARADELGCDLVETTAHSGARPSHAEWQGQVFSRSGKSRKYPDFVQVTGYGTGEGLGGWNCSHSFYPFFEGLPRTYSDKLLDSYKAKNYEYNGKKMTEYEALQTQRGIERKLRRWKRENIAMKAAGQDATESAVKIAQWQAVQKDFLAQTGLKRQRDREQIAGWSRKTAAQASGDVRKNTLTNAEGQLIMRAKKTTTTALPGSIKQVESAKGGISRNYYDDSGRWVLQVTNNDHGNRKQHPFGKNGEHAHDIIWKDGKIAERRVRELTDQEREENADIL